VKNNVITMQRFIELMSTRAREIIGLAEDSWVTIDLDAHYTIDPAQFVSMGKSTPFEGWEVYGRCIKNEVRGKVVFEIDN
jgi:dihydroorotase